MVNMDTKQYLKPEEREALGMKRDRERGGAIGEISWYVTTEDGREVLKVYRGSREIGL